MRRFTGRLLSRRRRLRRIPGLAYLYDVFKLLYKSVKLNHSLLKTGNFRFVGALEGYLPGHYYSPLPDYREVLARSQTLFGQNPVTIPGVDLQEQTQLELLDIFSGYYNDLPFPSKPRETTRYYYENGYFGHADVIALYSVLRHYEPSRVVEVGSGFSSAAMLDVNDRFLENKVNFTFVEPNPERLFDLLTEEDMNRHTILPIQVQDMPLERFQALSANDILFIDSSHVVKVGNDVSHIVCNILPELRPGVLVHFHDVLWPFEYPREWIVDAGRAFNEAYFLRAFLLFNSAFEIMYFNSFLAKRHTDILREKMPLCLQQPGSLKEWLEPTIGNVPPPPSWPSSLWLKKSDAAQYSQQGNR